MPKKRLTLGFVAETFGVSKENIETWIKDYNKTIGSAALKPSTLRDYIASGIEIHRAKGVSFAIGFLQYIRDNHYGGQTTPTYKKLYCEISESFEDRRAENGDGPSDMVRMTLRVQNYFSKNPEKVTQRESCRGHYVLVRQSTKTDVIRFYEEPLFIGGMSERTWLLSTKPAVYKGWTFNANGMLVISLQEERSGEIPDFRTLLVDVGRTRNERAFQGLLLRSGDDSSKPTCSRILVRPQSTPPTEEEQRLNTAVTLNDEDAARRACRTLSETDCAEEASFKRYKEAGLDKHLDVLHRDDWRDVLRLFDDDNNASNTAAEITEGD